MRAGNRAESGVACMRIYGFCGFGDERSRPVTCRGSALRQAQGKLRPPAIRDRHRDAT